MLKPKNIMKWRLIKTLSDCKINDITSENVLERQQVKTKCRSVLSKEFKETTWNYFLGLKEQSTVVSSIVSSSFAKDITKKDFRLTFIILPVDIWYLILANNSNLFRWKILPFSNRNLCLKPQTQLHIVHFCERTLDRLTWRDNSMLSSLCNHLNKKVCPDFKNS